MSALLEVKSLTKSFGTGKHESIALHSTNLNVNTGEFIIITGPSGAGKSTLLTILGGLQRPTSGEVLFKGKNIFKLSNSQLTKLRMNNYGFILQTPQLIPFLTVIEQFKLIDKLTKKKNIDNAEFLLKKMDVWQDKNLYPSALSGGERQRVAIAKALYKKPQLIFADEPTAALDYKRSATVINTLKEIAQNHQTSIIMITHDDNLLKYGDKVYIMINGNLQPYNNNLVNNK